jgi:hypothetical protein
MNEIMNVTIKINDELVKQARHEAFGDGLSLSGWVAQLISEKLSDKSPSKSLLEAIGNEKLAELDMDFQRSQSTSRELTFE